MRFEIGGRVGYAMPIGSLNSSTKLKDVFTGTIPGVLDLWARLPGGVAIGGYFGIAAGIQGTPSTPVQIAALSTFAAAYR